MLPCLLHLQLREAVAAEVAKTRADMQAQVCACGSTLQDSC